MPEWVKNKSEKPIPEPYAFTPQEQRLLHELQKRKHLEKYDDKYKRMPLCSEFNCRESHVHERTMLDELENRIRLGAQLMFRAWEVRFAPGQIFEVPTGFASPLVALRPEKLQALQWGDVRHFQQEPPRIRFQTPREAMAIILDEGNNAEDGSLHHVPVAVEMKDGRVRHGDSKIWDQAPTGLDPAFAEILTRVQ